MTIEELVQSIETKFPKRNAEEWDNIGLLIGEKKTEIKGIVITLDVDFLSIEKAIKNGANMIISHHPIFFKGIKKIDYSTVEGQKIKILIQNEISVYCIHTNVDTTAGGLNDYLLEKMGIYKSKVLKEGLERGVGIGRYYKLEKEMTIKDYIEEVKKSLGLTSVVFYGNEEGKCKKIAVVNGSGGDFWNQAQFICCDLLITGDVKYHTAFDAVESGLNILDIGHYESEMLFLNLMEREIKEINNKLEIFPNKKEFFRKKY